MENKIKQFIDTDAMSAVEADAETAGYLITEAIYEKWQPIARKYERVVGVGEVPKFFTTNFSLLTEIEKTVIEKVGKYEYGEALISIFGMSGSHRSGISSVGICEIATATAHQRIAAMLSALSEGEDE